MAFADALQKVGAKPELVLYPGKSHTDLFLQVSHDWMSIVIFINFCPLFLVNAFHNCSQALVNETVK